MTTEDPAASGGESMPEPNRLGGRYELGAVLGSGGMAVVRLGTDVRLGRTVAVKMLRGELAEAPAFQARFRREARAAAALAHRSIVSVYDAGEETVDGVAIAYIVMEYVEGQTLRDLVHSGPRSPHEALEITADILDALEQSHLAGIVHRDVKPANVMITPSGTVKVMDFGVARAVADMSAALTQTSTVIGTAHYLSPEQARGDSVDARSDVYSTGCLLYELLAGRPPFLGDSAIAVAYQHVREAPQPPSALEPSVPPEADAIVLNALAKRPDERYQSAAEMRRDILGVLAGEQPVVPFAAADTSMSETTAEQPAVGAADVTAVGFGAAAAEAEPDEQAAMTRRHRKRVGLLVAAAAVLVLALGGYALSTLGADPGTRDAEQGRSGAEPSRTPTSQETSGNAEPAGSSNVGPVDNVDQPQPRPHRTVRTKPTKASTTAAAKPSATQNAKRPTPTQSAQPSRTPSPSPTPTPEQTTASQSQPPETTQPPPSSSAPPPSTTSSPAAGGAEATS